MHNLKPHERIIFALDTNIWNVETRSLLHTVRPRTGILKIGLEAMHTRVPTGWDASDCDTTLAICAEKWAAEHVWPVMSDAKLGDTKNTVGKAMANIARSHAWGCTVLANEGDSVVEAAVENCGETKVIGVTYLTSRTDKECDYYYRRFPASLVKDLASMLVAKGAHAVVCSPRELDAVNEADPGHCLLRITPSIRAHDAPPDDQKRTMTAGEAIRAGADYLVIGRPISQAKDPVRAAEEIAEEIGTARANLVAA